MKKRNGMKKLVAALVSSALTVFWVAPPAQAASIKDSITLDITVQTLGDAGLSLDVRNSSNQPISALPAVTLPPGRSSLKRIPFGELKIDYFVADAFDLRCFTSDGIDVSGSKTGIPGVRKNGEPLTFVPPRLDLRVWTPVIGPNPNSSGMLTPQDGNGDGYPDIIGTVSSNARVPDPKENVLWNDQTNGVWKFVGERESRALDVSGSPPYYALLSTTLDPITGRTYVSEPGDRFRVYFAVDLLGVDDRKYMTDTKGTTSEADDDGRLYFELVTK
ncbi:MAG: hypothetical protein HYY14_02035 [Candidatus Omnitrophica bacterium]|nr:hypothetical protein [Candidatus Omnitrophota bacterium]